MADQFVELTRNDAELRGASVIVNLGNVAWIEPGDGGTSRLVFAVGLPYERANGVPLSLLVREAPEVIALLAGVPLRADREAIAQAWMEQTARRSRDADRT